MCVFDCVYGECEVPCQLSLLSKSPCVRASGTGGMKDVTGIMAPKCACVCLHQCTIVHLHIYNDWMYVCERERRAARQGNLKRVSAFRTVLVIFFLSDLPLHCCNWLLLEPIYKHGRPRRGCRRICHRAALCSQAALVFTVFMLVVPFSVRLPASHI